MKCKSRLISYIFADHQIDEDEARLLRKYAIAIGYTSTEAERIIKRSIQIYSGGLDFYDYEYLIKRK